MTPRRGPIGMGDALTAARALHVSDPEQLRVLTELLGLARVEPAAPEPDPPTSVGRGARGAGLTAARVVAEVTAEGEVAGDSGLRTVAEPLPPEPVAPIAYVVAEPLSPAPSTRRVAHRPIRPPHQLRAALTMLIRRPRPSLRLDLDAAVDLIAERQPLDRLPRLVEQTVDGGVRIVADVSAEMLPYLDDIGQLVEIARHVAGEPMTEVTWVEDVTEVPVPETDRPVLVISALGATRAPGRTPGAELGWRSLAEQLAAADVTAVVPHGRTRRRVPDGVRCVVWDDLGEVNRGRR